MTFREQGAAPYLTTAHTASLVFRRRWLVAGGYPQRCLQYHGSIQPTSKLARRDRPTMRLRAEVLYVDGCWLKHDSQHLPATSTRAEKDYITPLSLRF